MEDCKIQILFEDGLSVEYDNLGELAASTKIPKSKLRHIIASKKRIPGVLRLTVISPRASLMSDVEVVQYDELGNEVKRYKNANEAQAQTGINNIYKALNGTVNTAGGYIWKYVDNTIIEPQCSRAEIILLSETCEIIGTYRNAKEAADDTCLEKQDIERSMLELSKTEIGFFIKINSKNNELIELHKNGCISKIYKKLCFARLKTGLTNSQIGNSYSRNAYIGDVKYIRLETLLESIRNEQ